MGPSWSVLGRLGRPEAASWGSLGSLLEASWGLRGRPLGAKQVKINRISNQPKIVKKCWFDFSDGLGGLKTSNRLHCRPQNGRITIVKWKSMLRSAKQSPTEADSGGTLHAESHSGPEWDSAWNVPPESASDGDSFANLNIDVQFTTVIRPF